jgi:tetratricopeptide (TPR) repeat protein
LAFVGSGSGDCELVIGKQETNAVVGAKSTAQKAVDIDDSLGEAHLALARVIQLYDWDWPRVEQEYRRAMALNQNDALAHGLFGEFLQEMGRNQEALPEFRPGAALDPLTPGALATSVLRFIRHVNTRRPWGSFKRGSPWIPKMRTFTWGLGWVYGQKKMCAEAIAELEKAVSLSARHENPLASLGEVLAESGREREAAQISGGTQAPIQVSVCLSLPDCSGAASSW